MGVQTTELWSNLGLCTFYSGQYDMTLACFDRALGLADGELSIEHQMKHAMRCPYVQRKPNLHDISQTLIWLKCGTT